MTPTACIMPLFAVFIVVVALFERPIANVIKRWLK